MIHTYYLAWQQPRGHKRGLPPALPLARLTGTANEWASKDPSQPCLTTDHLPSFCRLMALPLPSTLPHFNS